MYFKCDTTVEATLLYIYSQRFMFSLKPYAKLAVAYIDCSNSLESSLLLSLRQHLLLEGKKKEGGKKKRKEGWLPAAAIASLQQYEQQIRSYMGSLQSFPTLLLGFHSPSCGRGSFSRLFFILKIKSSNKKKGRVKDQ